MCFRWSEWGETKIAGFTIKKNRDSGSEFLIMEWRLESSASQRLRVSNGEWRCGFKFMFGFNSQYQWLGLYAILWLVMVWWTWWSIIFIRLKGLLRYYGSKIIHSKLPLILGFQNRPRAMVAIMLKEWMEGREYIIPATSPYPARTWGSSSISNRTKSIWCLFN